MFGKVGLAALAVVPLLGATHTGDLRELYNEMYPVSALTRDAFNLCHESDATFVRALDADRGHCLDHMPHSFAVAIGWIRPDSDLLAWAPISDGERAALRLSLVAPTPPLQHAETVRQLAAFTDVRHVSATPALALDTAMDLLARPGTSIGDAALAGFVLAQRGTTGDPNIEPLPLSSTAAPTSPADPSVAVAAGPGGA